MKTESRARGDQSLSLPFFIAFLYCLTFAFAPLNLLADGCFVVPKFVWDKHRDINEPTQKAIIVHDAGRETLILQVKYDGPLEEFGWLIPVPNLPTVKKSSMECFYELSKFTQKNLEPRWHTATLSMKGGSAEEEPPVKVIEVKTVGAYDIAVLSTKDSAALENWLKENQFAFPANAAGVIDAYVKQHWYFTEGALAAANLLRLGTNGVSALIAAMQNTNPAVRAHAMSVAEQMFVVSPSNRRPDENEEDPSRRMLNPKLTRLLPTLLNDPNPEVRLHAVYAAENSESPMFFTNMLMLLRDDYAEVSEAAQGYLKQQRDEVPKHIPLFRQMLQDTNVNVQIAGLRLLMSIPQVDIPRDELLPLFSVPRMELAGAAVAYLKAVANLKKESVYITCEEAKPLLHNSLGMVRMMGLAVLMIDANNQSVQLAIPLLKDPEEAIRLRAHALLTDLTGQNFPAEQAEQWEKWWEQNKATFTVSISPEEVRKKQLERQRQRRRTENSSPP